MTAPAKWAKEAALRIDEMVQALHTQGYTREEAVHLTAAMLASPVTYVPMPVGDWSAGTTQH